MVLADHIAIYRTFRPLLVGALKIHPFVHRWFSPSTFSSKKSQLLEAMKIEHVLSSTFWVVGWNQYTVVGARGSMLNNCISYDAKAIIEGMYCNSYRISLPVVRVGEEDSARHAGRSIGNKPVRDSKTSTNQKLQCQMVRMI